MTKFLALFKLKAVADDNSNVAHMAQCLFDTEENIVGKGEMLFTSIFSFSHHIFYS